MQPVPLALMELLARLRWFVRLRWLAVVVVAGTVLGLALAEDGALPLPQLLLVVATLAAVNILYWVQLRRTDPLSMSARSALLTANVQIAVDLLFVTLLLHFLGGVENPFFFYYVFHVIIASILLPPLAAYLQATLAVALFGGLVALEFFGAVPHYAVALLGVGGIYRQGGYVLAVFAAFASTLYLAAYMATSIVGRLREREREIVALGERLQAEQGRLRQAYETLQQTEAAKSRYMREVGHRLRSPLAAVQTLLATLLDEGAEPLPERTRDLIARAKARAGEMLRVVDDLLALSRAREARNVVARRPVALGEIVSRVVNHFAAQTAARNTSLSTALPPSLPALQGDPAGLEDLVANLVANAIKYTAPGGSVRVSAEVADGHLVLRVADNGIGITPDELPQVFTEFYRSERARRMAREGTGLGLSIVRAVAEAHGGSIDVESAPGKGTTFSVRLPLDGPGGSRFDVTPASVAGNGSAGDDKRRAFHVVDPAHARARQGGTGP